MASERLRIVAIADRLLVAEHTDILVGDHVGRRKVVVSKTLGT